MFAAELFGSGAFGAVIAMGLFADEPKVDVGINGAFARGLSSGLSYGDIVRRIRGARPASEVDAGAIANILLAARSGSMR